MKAVLFDFDYTLADSSRGIITCVNYALKRMALTERSEIEIRKTIGLSLPDTFSVLTNIKEGKGRARFKELFLGRAMEIMPDMTDIYPDVRVVVDALVERGISLGIVSTKVAVNIRKPLEKNGLLSSFRVVIGGDDVARPKPDPEGIRSALQKIEARAEDCVYVGDGVIDFESARNAGVRFIGVLTGTTTRDQLERVGSETIIERIGLLPEHL